MSVKHWNKNEEDFLSANYEKFTVRELSEKLERSIEGIRTKLRRMGIKREDKNNHVNTFNLKPKLGKALKPIKIAKSKPEPKTHERSRSRKVYEILKPDLGMMIPVYIDHKTTIYIKQGQDPMEEKEKYLKRRLELVTVY